MTGRTILHFWIWPICACLVTLCFSFSSPSSFRSLLQKQKEGDMILCLGHVTQMGVERMVRAVVVKLGLSERLVHFVYAGICHMFVLLK